MFLCRSELRLTVETTLEAVWATLPEKILRMFVATGMRCASLSVRTLWVHMALDSLCDALDIELILTPQMPTFEKVRQNFDEHFRQ